MFFLLTALAVSPMVFCFTDAARYTRLFATLAIFFVATFFILPLNIAYYENSVRYVGLPVIFNYSDFAFSISCLFIFSLGFALFDMFNLRHRKSVGRFGEEVRLPHSHHRALTKMDACATLSVALVSGYFYFSSQYFLTIDSRQGNSEANQIFGLLTISLYFLGSFALIDLIEKKRYLLSFTHFSFLIFLAVNFAGRAQILLALTIPFLYLFRSVKIFALAFIFTVITLSPIILNGKEIVFNLFDNPSDLRLVGDYYANDVDFDALMSNFGHPLISLYYVDDTIRSTGYRYFWDLPHGFIFYLNFFGIDAGKSLTYSNTETILFRKESIIPPGYLAFGYIQASYFGVFFMGTFFRFTGIICKEVCIKRSGSSFSRDFFWAFIAANTFYAGEMRVLVLTYLLPVLVFVFYNSMNNRRLGRDLTQAA